MTATIHSFPLNPLMSALEACRPETLAVEALHNAADEINTLCHDLRKLEAGLLSMADSIMDKQAHDVFGGLNE